MRKILLALHGGATAEGAVRSAQLLGARTGATIEAVAVLEPLPTIDYGYGAGYIADPSTEDQLEQQLRVDVENQLTRADLPETKLSLMRGPRTAMIADAAAACRADLIVVGIGPHHLVDRALGGETALRLAQRAATPVLAVPAGVRSLPHRILVAVDYSPASLAAARLSASLLTARDTLELAHVGAGGHLGRVVFGPADISAAARRLEEFSTELQLPMGVHLVTTVVSGDPTRKLLDIARETNADTIALGSHGYAAWQRVLIGSVSSKVLRLAQCAVLVYPARCVAEAAQPMPAKAMAGSGMF
jgi:nucleotide-binding universal stress UspA family protein